MQTDFGTATIRWSGPKIVVSYFSETSLTLGWGVAKPRTSKRYWKRPERSKPTEIINLGAGNCNTEQEVNLFIEKGLKYKPDEVVVFSFINDAEPTPTKSGWVPLGGSRLSRSFGPDSVPDDQYRA